MKKNFETDSKNKCRMSVILKDLNLHPVSGVWLTVGQRCVTIGKNCRRSKIEATVSKSFRVSFAIFTWVFKFSENSTKLLSWYFVVRRKVASFITYFTLVTKTDSYKVGCVFQMVIWPEFRMGSIDTIAIGKMHPTLQPYDQFLMMIWKIERFRTKVTNRYRRIVIFWN